MFAKIPATRQLRIFSALFFGCISLAHAAEWYVAPTGKDEAQGTLSAPFATVQRAQKSANPGDTVYLRGGTYQIAATYPGKQAGNYSYITALDKSGKKGKPITYSAYQNEKPIFDCSAYKPANKRVGAFFVSGSWLNLKGIDVTGVQVTILEHTQSISFHVTGSNNILERLTMHDSQAIGVYINGSAANNLILNCDAWKNLDYTSEDKRGGNVDGFGCHVQKGGTGNIFRGCRSWYNSDDGFDCINNAEPVIFENCWAFYNGLNEKGERLHDGNGFKAGGYGVSPNKDLPSPIPRNIIRFCFAVGNRSSGFYANHHPGGNDWLNNTAYRNSENFNFLGRDFSENTDVPGTGHQIRNNISYQKGAEPQNLAAEKNQVDHNAFPPAFKLTDAAFYSVDEKQLLAPRKPNGDLPDLTFMKPRPSSRLIDTGANIGLPFVGKAPDVGAIDQ